MARGLLIFNIVLLVLVGVLFYLYFSSNKKNDASKITGPRSVNNTGNTSGIAYFEMDSVTNAFALVKDVKTELEKTEQQFSTELARMEKDIMMKAQEYKNQTTMSQVQSEIATKDLQDRQQNYQVKKAEYEQRYQDMHIAKRLEVRTKIEEFLKEYNESKRYSYIFSNEPGFIYYHDTVYNITADLIKGLNERFVKKKN